MPKQFNRFYKSKEAIQVSISKIQRVASQKNKQTFCGFPWVETSTAGRVYDLCVYYMTGAPEGSPKVVLSGFMVLWRSRESNLRPLVYKA